MQQQPLNPPKIQKMKRKRLWREKKRGTHSFPSFFSILALSTFGSCCICVFCVGLRIQPSPPLPPPLLPFPPLLPSGCNAVCVTTQKNVRAGGGKEGKEASWLTLSQVAACPSFHLALKKNQRILLSFLFYLPQDQNPHLE